MTQDILDRVQALRQDQTFSNAGARGVAPASQILLMHFCLDGKLRNPVHARRAGRPAFPRRATPAKLRG